mgnify:CR=1 FL=1
MLSESVRENMGLNDENFTETIEEPHNQELKMLLNLLKSGSIEEQRKFAQALLQMDRQA